jgi:GNAT superfamily N-acetyltransferase
MPPRLLSDRALAQRLERTEAHANRAFVESRARLFPDSGASWCEIDGTAAMFDGVGSPITQTFGLGTCSDATADQLSALEAFFDERQSATAHEVATTGEMSLLPLLSARGYRPIEWSAVLCQRLPVSLGVGSSMTVRRIDPHEVDRWADTAARGWGETPELADFVRGFGVVSANAADTHAFLVEFRGEALAAGSLHLHEGVALMAGASTVPEHRGQGAQHLLLAARLHFAMEQGADLAMIVAAPGSASQRNAQRAGFEIAYSRVKFERPMA